MQLKIFISILFLAFAHICLGQGGDAQKQAPVLLDEQKELQSQIIPLDSILELAEKNSPSVKFQKDLIESTQSQLEVTKRLWTNNIVGFVNYSAGNQSIVSADNQSPGTQSAYNITTGLRMGVQINLPLNELVGRKSRLKIYRADLSSAINKKDESVQ